MIKMEETKPVSTTATVQFSMGSYTKYGNSHKKRDIIQFGHYPQDADGTVKLIDWMVLDRKSDGQALLISKYALDCKKYNEGYTGATWETCTLRSWLNREFYNKAFNSSEQTHIATTRVTADKKPKYNINPGRDTQDKVFLLSIPEAEKYFTSDEERKCVPTAYTVSHGAYASDWTLDGKYTCWWWLRSPGYHSNDAASVNTFGAVYSLGNLVISDASAVRPVLWINL